MEDWEMDEVVNLVTRWSTISLVLGLEGEVVGGEEKDGGEEGEFLRKSN